MSRFARTFWLSHPGLFRAFLLSGAPRILSCSGACSVSPTSPRSLSYCCPRPLLSSFVSGGGRRFESLLVGAPLSPFASSYGFFSRQTIRFRLVYFSVWPTHAQRRSTASRATAFGLPKSSIQVASGNSPPLTTWHLQPG